MKIYLALAIGGGLLGGLLAAADLAAAQSASAPALLTAEQVIAARQASLDMSVMTMAEMKIAVRDGTDIKKESYPAGVLAKWARVLPSLFPAGTGPGATAMQTHALPAIWTDRAGFEKAAANYASAADKLSEFARADDAAGFAQQLGVVSKACDACHSDYKLKY